LSSISSDVPQYFATHFGLHPRLSATDRGFPKTAATVGVASEVARRAAPQLLLSPTGPGRGMAAAGRGPVTYPHPRATA
jgi:hypothetical protein